MSGMVTAIQSKKVIRRSVRSRIMPIAIRFGGEPTGMPTATEDDHVSIRRSPIARRLGGPSAGSPSARRTPTPTGSMMAVVAVLLIQSERPQHTTPIASMIRDVDRVVHS